MKRILAAVVLAVGLLPSWGCEGDVNRPNDKGGPEVKVQGTPDLNPSTDHDIDVKTGDVDVDVHRRPGGLPDVDVDVAQPPDADHKANEDEPAGVDR